MSFYPMMTTSFTQNKNNNDENNVPFNTLNHEPLILVPSLGPISGWPFR